MPTKRTVSQNEHIEYHKDGSIWAKGQMVNGVPAGYWEWFRLDGTRMRSGHFENGEQAGEWTTFDKKGQVYKVTKMKPKAKKVAMLPAHNPSEHSMPTPKAPAPASKRPPKKTPAADTDKSPSELIDRRIAELQDWRGEMLARLRTLIAGTDREITEEWKWNIPVWSCRGIICTGETYKKAVKLTFAKGASIEDPSRLFNSSLDGNTRRAIDFPEGSRVDKPALRALIRAAVRLNKSSSASKAKRS